MKKVLCALLALILVLSLAACGKTNGTDKPDATTAANETNGETEGNTSADAEKPKSGKTLVVFYSATGSTKSVAEAIATSTGADMFEITPESPYTSDDLNWSNSNSRVSVEHNDESKRVVPLTKATPDNWSEYDTVYIGYPIWWGIAAWPVNGFISSNDFSGKTVIPFCTSASSGLGQSGKLLEQAAGTGNWLEGKRFSSGASSAEVEEWVKGLDA